jgi:hypothetical protein
MTGTPEWIPKREEIERRAYEVYLERGAEDGHAAEHWLMAEEELRQEHAKRREPAVPLKAKTVVAGAGGIAKAVLSSVDGSERPLGETQMKKRASRKKKPQSSGYGKPEKTNPNPATYDPPRGPEKRNQEKDTVLPIPPMA